MNAAQASTYADALAQAFASDISAPPIAAVLARGELDRKQFGRIVLRDVAKELDGAPGPALFPAVRAFARQAVDIAAIRRARAAGMSAVDTTSADIGGISSLVGAIAGAVGAIYATKINTDAQKKLASIAAQEATIQQNSQAIAAQSALIKNATANGMLVGSGGEVVGPIGSASQTTLTPGLPVIALGTAALATVVGAWYAFKN